MQVGDEGAERTLISMHGCSASAQVAASSSATRAELLTKGRLRPVSRRHWQGRRHMAPPIKLALPPVPITIAALPFGLNRSVVKSVFFLAPVPGWTTQSLFNIRVCI